MSDYSTQGYVLEHGLISRELIDRLLSQYLTYVNENNPDGLSFSDAHDPKLAQYMNDNRGFQTEVYNHVRQFPWLEEFAQKSGLSDVVNKLVQESGIAPEAYLLKKIVFRMDMPRETSELAVWHQDHYYVQGNPEVVTAWIPLQDTRYIHGCLSIMPGSHKLGIVPHTVNVLKKKYVPEGIYDREIRYAEMNKGDALLFHGLLFHSSNINISDIPRYSLQIRFTPKGYDMPPAMGGIATN